MEPRPIPLNELLLDPNNYRLQEQEGFSTYPDHRFHIDRVQDKTRRRLQNENLGPLRNSIVANGFLEIERIVVVPYEHEVDKYLVIEGNRRVAALLNIREEHAGGVEIPGNVVRVFDAVPCLVVDGTDQEAYFREAIMGIRHVGGIRQWGGYQRASLVANMRDNHQLDASVISERIGLSVIEVNRRYRAFKALQQMKGDENYGEHATAQLYPLFHEAVSLPDVREWLGWNTETFTFDDDEQREIFYQLISPRIPEHGEALPPKLKAFSDVRSLREILPNGEAKADLLQMEREFVDALTIANRDKMSQRWRNEVNEARTALANIPALEVEQFEEADIQAIQGLIDTAETILVIHGRARDER